MLNSFLGQSLKNLSLSCTKLHVERKQDLYAVGYVDTKVEKHITKGSYSMTRAIVLSFDDFVPTGRCLYEY